MNNNKTMFMVVVVVAVVALIAIITNQSNNIKLTESLTGNAFRSEVQDFPEAENNKNSIENFIRSAQPTNDESKVIEFLRGT